MSRSSRRKKDRLVGATSASELDFAARLARLDSDHRDRMERLLKQLEDFRKKTEDQTRQLLRWLREKNKKDKKRAEQHLSGARASDLLRLRYASASTVRAVQKQPQKKEKGPGKRERFLKRKSENGTATAEEVIEYFRLRRKRIYGMSHYEEAMSPPDIDPHHVHLDLEPEIEVSVERHERVIPRSTQSYHQHGHASGDKERRDKRGKQKHKPSDSSRSRVAAPLPYIEDEDEFDLLSPPRLQRLPSNTPFVSQRPPLHVVIIGPGQIGQTIAAMLAVRNRYRKLCLQRLALYQCTRGFVKKYLQNTSGRQYVDKLIERYYSGRYHESYDDGWKLLRDKMRGYVQNEVAEQMRAFGHIEDVYVYNPELRRTLEMERVLSRKDVRQPPGMVKAIEVIIDNILSNITSCLNIYADGDIDPDKIKYSRGKCALDSRVTFGEAVNLDAVAELQVTFTSLIQPLEKRRAEDKLDPINISIIGRSHRTPPQMPRSRRDSLSASFTPLHSVSPSHAHVEVVRPSVLSNVSRERRHLRGSHSARQAAEELEKHRNELEEDPFARVDSSPRVPEMGALRSGTIEAIKDGGIHVYSKYLKNPDRHQGGPGEVIHVLPTELCYVGCNMAEIPMGSCNGNLAVLNTTKSYALSNSEYQHHIRGLEVLSKRFHRKAFFLVQNGVPYWMYERSGERDSKFYREIRKIRKNIDGKIYKKLGFSLCAAVMGFGAMKGGEARNKVLLTTDPQRCYTKIGTIQVGRDVPGLHDPEEQFTDIFQQDLYETELLSTSDADKDPFIYPKDQEYTPHQSNYPTLQALINCSSLNFGDRRLLNRQQMKQAALKKLCINLFINYLPILVGARHLYDNLVEAMVEAVDPYIEENSDLVEKLMKLMVFTKANYSRHSRHAIATEFLKGLFSSELDLPGRSVREFFSEHLSKYERKYGLVLTNGQVFCEEAYQTFRQDFLADYFSVERDLFNVQGGMTGVNVESMCGYVHKNHQFGEYAECFRKMFLAMHRKYDFMDDALLEHFSSLRNLTTWLSARSGSHVPSTVKDFCEMHNFERLHMLEATIHWLIQENFGITRVRSSSSGRYREVRSAEATTQLHYLHGLNAIMKMADMLRETVDLVHGNPSRCMIGPESQTRFLHIIRSIFKCTEHSLTPIQRGERGVDFRDSAERRLLTCYSTGVHLPITTPYHAAGRRRIHKRRGSEFFESDSLTVGPADLRLGSHRRSKSKANVSATTPETLYSGSHQCRVSKGKESVRSLLGCYDPSYSVEDAYLDELLQPHTILSVLAERQNRGIV